MTEIEIIRIIYMTAAGLTVIATVILNRLQANLIKAQKIALYELYKSNDEVMEYCLSNILKDSVIKEDLETSARCKKLIDELRNKV
jgi:hypothetical protein